MAALIQGVPPSRTRILVDTNIMIEAKRVGVWNAFTGGFQVVTVSACVEEATSGNREERGYVGFTDEQLSRIKYVHKVSPLERARFKMASPDIELDRGEEDLLAYAHALRSQGDSVWVLCSADKAAVRAALHVGLDEQLVSLGSALGAVAARPKIALRSHFEQRFLSVAMTEFRLG